ncbi:glycosyltransferase family 2 protein [Pontibacter sp. MBLB2868]|uniref:glycosyltransferase family 2 protein n=1 Tax=Pontibacter sp. MBLB2868 TaxID=3451555 RepID=UPI003F74DA00
MYRYDIAASIVAYNNDPAILNNAINSFLDTNLRVGILIIDNSPSNTLVKLLVKDERVYYIFNGSNVGFSKAHNQGIAYFKNKAKYFLVLNPDVFFEGNTIDILYSYLELNPQVGLTAPRVVYPNGEEQISRRLIPTPADLLIRRLPLAAKLFSTRTKANEYHNVDSQQILEVPFLLGCFLLFKMDALEQVGYFDERYFVYLEDLDICRRMDKHFKVIYYGHVKIYHHYQRASSKSLTMLFHHTISVVKYFNKWGWFIDAERKAINKSAMAARKVSKVHKPNDYSRKYAATL